MNKRNKSTEKKTVAPKEVSVTSISSARKIAVLLLVVGLAVGLYYFFTKKEKQGPQIETVRSEPQFLKEGELGFIKQESQDTLLIIDIEIADSPEERTQGYMYRSSMPDSAGMLFIFEKPTEQTFWMKNMKISLDLLYIDENKKIVTLYKHQRPYSENPIPSMKNAQYVLEVNGGFVDKHQIEEGDYIFFEQDEQLTKN